MSFAPSQLDELLAFALESAREAAAIVHAGWRKHPRIEHKSAVELVTSYDRESERLLRERLAARTGISVVGEEEGGERGRGAREPTWYVDPLDGTTNFVHGHPFYCVSVGLVSYGEGLVGAVVAPALGNEWAGRMGAPATRDGVPCRVSTTSAIEDALLATGFPYDRSTSADNNFEAFVAIKRACQAVRRCGSSALDLCLVADGTYDGYWERKLNPWDFAAGAAIVRAAGGIVSGFDGRGVDLMTGHLVATNGAIHDVLLHALARATPSSVR